jgi:hydrogenase expression/formation protein HypC
MCLAIPGKIVSVDKSSSPRTGIVSFGGVEKEVCLEWTPEAGIGDYVIVHVGFAISVLDQADAEETLRLLREMDGALDELGGAQGNEAREE